MKAEQIAVKVDPELRALIPPVSEGERAMLEASLLAEGCRDALVIWEGHDTLLDGHTRRDICKQHGIKYEVTEVACTDRAAAKEWIIRN